MAISYSSSRRRFRSRNSRTHLETLRSSSAALTRNHRATSSGKVMVMFFTSHSVFLY